MQSLLFFEKLELELVIADPEGEEITVAPIMLMPPSAVFVQLITNRAFVLTLSDAVLNGVIKVVPIKFGIHLMELQTEAQRPTQQQGQCA